MKLFKLAFLAFAIFAAFHSAQAGVSFTIGTDDFYLSVGDYDYLPYAFATSPSYVAPRISFHDALNDYGYWVDVSPFGPAWVPFASYGWRPYTQGRWIWTSQGWYWQAYEPWGWLAYHYGHWVWNSRFGWVWLPDYDWHPGRVVWARGYDTIGWMPAPPHGYDYSRGYLAFIGDENQFSYYDDDFDYYDDDYSYGGPYYDPQYRDMYYNSNYQRIGINLWVFIGNNHFGYDNYADYYMDQDYTRYVFDRRVIRISSQPVKREVIERVVRQKIVEIPVVEREIETDKKRIRVMVPMGGEEEKVRKNANRVVREVIAPAFVEKNRTFKGEKSKNKSAVAKLFKQENKAPKVQTINSDVLVREAQEVKRTREVKRGQNIQKEKQQVEQIEKQGKVRQPKEPKKQRRVEPPVKPLEPQVEQQQERRRSKEIVPEETEKMKRVERPKEAEPVKEDIETAREAEETIREEEKKAKKAEEELANKKKAKKKKEEADAKAAAEEEKTKKKKKPQN